MERPWGCKKRFMCAWIDINHLGDVLGAGGEQATDMIPDDSVGDAAGSGPVEPLCPRGSA